MQYNTIHILLATKHSAMLMANKVIKWKVLSHTAPSAYIHVTYIYAAHLLQPGVKIGHKPGSELQNLFHAQLN